MKEVGLIPNNAKKEDEEEGEGKKFVPGIEPDGKVKANWNWI